MIIKTATIFVVSHLLLLLPATLPQTVDWQKFASNDGRFTVLFPGTPKNETKDVETDAGKVSVHMFYVEYKETAYVAMYTDFPVEAKDEGIEAALDSGRDRGLEAANAQLVSEKKITLNGYPGREIRAKGKDPAENSVLVSRFFLAKRRLYQVIVAGPGGQIDSGAEEKFLSSFDIVTAEKSGG
jgi:hypothetical protein